MAAGSSGTVIDVSLLSPSGLLIDANTVSPDVYHESGDGFAVYYIDNPEPGDWTVNIYGASVPPEGTDVSASATADPSTTPPDIDGDSCINDAELQTAVGSQASGGLRDPLDPWDYMNPSGDGVNRVDDILLVVQAYFDDDSDGTPGLPPYAAGYNPDTDRTLVGPNAWNLGPPNGLQRIDDVLHALKQYFHDCP